MNEDIKKRVKSCFTDLSTSFDPEGYILGKLFQNDVLTVDQVQEINLIPESDRRAEKLLYLLFTIPHPRAFVVLREALKRDYAWIVELLDGKSKDSPCFILYDGPKTILYNSRLNITKTTCCSNRDIYREQNNDT